MTLLQELFFHNFHIFILWRNYDVILLADEEEEWITASLNLVIAIFPTMMPTMMVQMPRPLLETPNPLLFLSVILLSLFDLCVQKKVITYLV